MDEELPFRLGGITREELMENLYLDPNEYVDLPSDEESNVDDIEVDEEAFVNQENIEMILEDEDSEDDIPLAEIRENLRSAEPPTPTERIPSKWSKRYTVVPPSPMIEDCSLPDFVKELDSAYKLFSLFISEELINDIVFKLTCMPNKYIKHLVVNTSQLQRWKFELSWA